MKKEEVKKDSGCCGCLTVILLILLIGGLIANPGVTLVLIFIAIMFGIFTKK